MNYLKKHTLLLSLGLTLALGACTNVKSTDLKSRSGAKVKGAGGITDLNGNNLGVAGMTFNIASISISGSGGNDNSTTMLLFFPDVTNNTTQKPVTSACNMGATATAPARPCVCKVNWVESNHSVNPPISTTREIRGAVANVQTTNITCRLPKEFAMEIPDGLKVKVSVVAATGNPERFNVAEKEYVKGTNSPNPQSGPVLNDIMRYSCYDQVQRGMKISSAQVQGVHEKQAISFIVPMSSRFCLSDINGSSTECNGQENTEEHQPQYSAQAYYYNLYLPESRSSGFNTGNQRYKCPRVTKNLVADQQNTLGMWPMDSSFSLSPDRTPDFNIGVEAYSNLSGADTTTFESSCGRSINDNSTQTAAKPDSLVKACVGFAAKPRPDGSCPRVAGKQTYRLRRYVAVYPPYYRTGGQMFDETQMADTVFVLDRPVQVGDSEEATIRGPKPCPFAYYDHKRVHGSPAYVATNDSRWEPSRLSRGKNPDGIKFPNADIPGVNGVRGHSCTASLPEFDNFTKQWKLQTLKGADRYVRPSRPWSPHYEEDTDFQACAPQAARATDPPLHFQKDTETGNVSWCAEVTPTLNPYLPQIQSELGAVHYTSHVAKNMTPAVACSGANGLCHHEVMMEDTTYAPLWKKFPLLAPERQVERALDNDPSYQCTFTNNRTLAGKTPTGGCCAGVNVRSGIGVFTGENAHYEPQAGNDPLKRFCQKPQHQP